jgi:hypothetical protein
MMARKWLIKLYMYTANEPQQSQCGDIGWPLGKNCRRTIGLNFLNLFMEKMASTIFMNNSGDFAGHDQPIFGMKVRR